MFYVDDIFLDIKNIEIKLIGIDLIFLILDLLIIFVIGYIKGYIVLFY